MLIDTSVQMCDKYIDGINSVMRNLISDLQFMDSQMVDSKFRLNVMEFNACSTWHVYNMGGDSTIHWCDLQANKSNTRNIGGAFSELNKKLSRKDGGFLQLDLPHYRPIIILLISGESIDDAKIDFDLLKENKWFNNSICIAYSVGDMGKSQIMTTLAEFIQNRPPSTHNIDPRVDILLARLVEGFNKFEIPNEVYFPRKLYNDCLPEKNCGILCNDPFESCFED